MDEALAKTEEWRRRMLNKLLFVVQAQATGAGDRSSLLQDHLAFMTSLEQRGLLFAAGPLLDEAGAPSGDGLVILRAGSTAEAVELMAADPYVTAGLRTVKVRPWRVMEGSVTVRLSYAAGTFQLD